LPLYYSFRRQAAVTTWSHLDALKSAKSGTLAFGADTNMTEPLLVGDKGQRSDKMGDVKIRSPTIIFLQRARMVFMLTALIPTVFMTVIGIVILATGGSKSAAVVGGILVLAFCGTALAGYVLGTILVSRGPA